MKQTNGLGPVARVGSVLASLALTLLGAAAPAGSVVAGVPADEVYTGGAVYTGNPAQPWAHAMAVGHGRILAVGDDATIRALVGPSTRVVALDGRMVMPGLIDDHVHGIEGASGELYDCLFPSTSTPDEIAKVLAGCVKRTAHGAWIGGGRWSSTFFEEHHIASPRRWLDAITGDRPLIWRDDTGHNVWANSAALKRAGVDAHTKNPTGGRFEREADGVTPNGVAYEGAAEVVQAAVSPMTPAQYRASVLRLQQIAHRFGVIGVKDADAAERSVAAYRAAERRGELSLYVATSISTIDHQDKPDELLDFDGIDRIRDAYQGTLVRTDFVKIYLDGVPTPARTAVMLDLYLPDAEGHLTRGELHVRPDILKQDIVELDKRGYTVKMHAAGDGSVRAGLDAIEAARKANPGGTLRHELAHAGYISAEDIGRFAQLNAVAEFSPVIWYPSPIIDAVISAVGERGRHYWPMKTLIKSGARTAAGSDWPSVVPSMDPWTGVQAMVTRSDPYHASTETLWPEEAISLADALSIYTRGGAAGLKREAQTGTLEPGKSADFIILDRNLFEIPIREVTSERVDATYFQGRRVYARARPAAH